MASHFKQPDDTSPTPWSASSAAGGASGDDQQVGVRTSRGGDESYHAPAGNPHAAGTPHRADAGYISVMSEPDGKRRGHNRRRRESHFVETDPYDLSGRRSRDPKKRAARVISTLLFVVGVVLIVVAGGMWVYNQWQYSEQDRINEELASYADVSDDGATPPQVDWEALKAVNNEVVGWVQIPGTVVNFPVYQSTDNEKYLHTSAEGTYSLGGQVFMDYENTAPGMIDGQTIIYGHHLRNGAMFKPISDMSNQEMFDSVSTIWYVTEDATYELEPLFLYETDASDTNVRQFTFSSDEELRSYLTGLLGQAVTQRSDAAELISSATNVLTLCTCNYDNGDSGRTLLVCIPKATSSTEEAGAEASETTAEDTATDAATGE